MLRCSALLALGPIVCLGMLITGCDDREITITYAGFNLASPFQVKTTSGETMTVGHVEPPRPNPTPEPNPDASIGEKLGMQGDKTLCRPDTQLSQEQRTHVADLRRRLGNIITRLGTSSSTILFAGEKNTIKETPPCDTFGAEIAALAKILIKPQAPANPGSGTTPRPANEGDVDSVDLVQASHGWLVMNMKLTNGKTAVFDLGVEGSKAEKLLNSQEYVVEPRITNQNLGIHFVRTDFDYENNDYTFERSCTFSRTRTICERDPAKPYDSPVCKEVTISEPGRQSVTRTSSTSTYVFETRIFSADRSKTLAVVNFNGRVYNPGYESAGPCVPEDYGRR